GLFPTLALMAPILGLCCANSGAADADRRFSLESGGQATHDLGRLRSGETYRLLVSLVGSPLGPDERVRLEFSGSGGDRIAKDLHAGDPDLYLPYRAGNDGAAVLKLQRTPDRIPRAVDVRVEWARLDLPDADRPAIEAEPNDSWRQANPLVLGR